MKVTDAELAIMAIETETSARVLLSLEGRTARVRDAERAHAVVLELQEARAAGWDGEQWLPLTGVETPQEPVF